MLLRLVWLLAALVVAGCDGPTTVSLDGGAPDAASPASSGRIVVEGATSIALAPTEDASFVARWLDAEGRPVAGRDVSFALDGMPRDATLFSIGARTDEEGRVSGTVIAGREAATFRVRVAAPGATPAYLDVAVSATGFGRLVVTVQGGEGRDITQRAVLLHQASSTVVPCDDALTRRDADRSRNADASGEVVFNTLPAAQRFTIVARASNATGVVVAEGCVEGVEIVAEAETRAPVELVARTLGVEGEYEAELALSGGGSPRTAADAIGLAFDAAVLAGGGDAALMLDALASELDALGATDALAALEAQRAAGEAELGLEVLLTTEGATLSSAVHARLDELVTLHGALAIEGVLFVAGSPAGPVASFTRGDVRLGEAGEPLVIDLRALGVAARAPTAVRWNDASDELAIDQLRIELPLGTSMMAALDTLALQRGAADRVALVASEAGCESLATWIAGSAEIAAACDEACAAAACRGAAAGALETVAGAASSVDALRARIVLTGALASQDADGNLTVDALSAEALGGAWRSADGLASEPVEGSFGGARISPLP